MTDTAARSPRGLTDLVALRRDLHQHPELPFAEHRTSQLLGDRLERLGYDVRRHVGRTGVVGTLRGSAIGLHVVLRADMDAMPVMDLKTRVLCLHQPWRHACLRTRHPHERGTGSAS